MMRVSFRRARVLHRCRCGKAILPGDDYIDTVISPGHEEIGNAGWWRDAECRECSIRYGRWPIPDGGVMQR